MSISQIPLNSLFRHRFPHVQTPKIANKKTPLKRGATNRKNVIFLNHYRPTNSLRTRHLIKN